MSDPKQRAAAAGKTGRHDRKTGQFGPNNNAGTGGLAGWQKNLRNLLKEDALEARAHLRRAIRGEGKDGKPDPDIKIQDQNKAAEIVLRFTLPMPKQRVKVERDGKDPLAGVSPEELVAFIVGKK